MKRLFYGKNINCEWQALRKAVFVHCLSVVFLVFGLLGAAFASTADDRFIAGYITAVLEREFNLHQIPVEVMEGVVRLPEDSLAGLDKKRVIETLSAIKDVKEVHIFSSGQKNIPDPASAERPTVPDAGNTDRTKPVEHRSDSDILPRGRLFQPLIADPRWPHFSVAYHYYLDNTELKNAGATSFGESIALLRGETSGGWRWQLDIQAGVFAVFDLDAASMDLINADYWVGFPLSYQKGPFSGVVRIFHQSSHLGDEFLLRNTVERVNLSYESIDAKFSYDLSDWLRLYAGGGYIFHREPSELKPWSIHYGIELKTRETFLEVLRPVAGADFKNWEENNWHPDVSVRLGFQLESERKLGRRMQFMLEYFKGHSPHGQFYSREIEYLGIGTHFYF